MYEVSSIIVFTVSASVVDSVRSDFTDPVSTRDRFHKNDLEHTEALCSKMLTWSGLSAHTEALFSKKKDCGEIGQEFNTICCYFQLGNPGNDLETCTYCMQEC